MFHVHLSAKRLSENTVNPKDFGVDHRTGFIPAQQPLRRLPALWETWEAMLDAAMSQRLKAVEQTLLLDARQKLAEEEKARAWRKTVAEVWMEVPR